jgi:hypothetical protein
LARNEVQATVDSDGGADEGEGLQVVEEVFVERLLNRVQSNREDQEDHRCQGLIEFEDYTIFLLE